MIKKIFVYIKYLQGKSSRDEHGEEEDFGVVRTLQILGVRGLPQVPVVVLMILRTRIY